MESIYNKDYLLILLLWTLMFLNSAESYCVKKDSQSVVASSPGSYSPSSSPVPTQSTPPSSSPSTSKSTSSSSGPSPTQSVSPSNSPSTSKSTQSFSSPSPTQTSSPTSSPSQSTSPSSGPSAPKSTPSSSSPSPTQSTSPTSSPSQSMSPSSSPSASKSTPSSSSPSPTQSMSPSSGPSAPKSTPSSSNPSPQDSTPSPTSSTPQSPSPFSSPSFQTLTIQTSAPSTSQNPPPQSTAPPTTQPPPTTQAQAPSTAQPTMMESPDDEGSTTSSPTASTLTHGLLDAKTTSTVANNEAINKICQHTDYPSLCLESITPFFNGKTDVMQVLAMAINASYAQTEQGIKHLDQQAGNPATSPDLASALKDCKENFGDALDNLEAAHDALEDNDIGTIQTMLSAALTDYVTCTDGLPGPNPLGIHSDKLNNMASNCLAIAELHK